MAETRTTCPYCGVGCGVIAEATPDGGVSVRGDPEHPANLGRLCSKGLALGETVGPEDRLLHPEIGGRRAGWDEALDLVAARFSQAIAEHGPDSVAFYVSGQLLTEDYYVANKLMKGFIGSANIDTNSRLCMSSAVAGHRRAFGTDTVPGTYEDLELADLVVLVGSNLAWCHPVLHQRLAAAKEARPWMKVVTVDPRRTMTADGADLHLPVLPDGDVALFNGLLAHLAAAGRIDRRYVAEHTSGLEAALDAARLPLAGTALETGVDEALLARFYDLFARTPRVMTIFSMGVNQSSAGTDKVNAIINCHLATGRIGRPGMGPFSITGQPNAMGGREVGGLANMLAAHMNLEDPDHRERVGRFWRAPAIASQPGLKAVDLFEAVGDGRIKALWIMATNPAVSMPDAGKVEAAIAACPFVVVSDVQSATDTSRLAHVRLPAAGWGEKDGTVTNSERRISRQRPFLPAPGEARPDWWIVTEVARRMGFAEAFAYGRPADIFREHAALSAFENGGERDFDIGAVASIADPDYDALAPFRWPLPAAGPARERFFGDGGFYTSDRRAHFVAVTTRRAEAADHAFPFLLNSGRIRDQWHTMTRTGRSPRLSQHLAEPFAEIHPLDAAANGIGDAALVRVTSRQGSIIVRALLTERQARGRLFVPMHWNDQFAADARADRLFASVVDPVSGQPALKRVEARIEPFAATAHGVAVLREKPVAIAAEYWALARCTGGWRLEFATTAEAGTGALAEALLSAPPGADRLALGDMTTGIQRLVCLDRNRLHGAVYLSLEPVAVSRSWLVEQLSAEIAPADRLALLAGRPARRGADRGAIVCSCFGVGANQIAEAARAGHVTVAAIGEALKAGTNCGSCRAEIGGIIAANRLQAAE